jgi:capsular polysaccharide biosynthesis protein
MVQEANFHHINNYYHFLIEVLPHIYHNQQSVYINSDVKLPEFIIDYSILLNFPITNYIVKDDNLVLNSCTKFVLPYKQKLKFLTNINPTSTKVFPKRLFISRKLSKRRKMSNEDLISKYLTDFGFETISLESYNIQEQIMLFKNADVILGTHGAGLSNIIYCKLGARVIEIKRNYVKFPSEPGFVDFIDCYKHISKLFNLNYSEILIEDLIPSNTAIAHYDFILTGCTIDTLSNLLVFEQSQQHKT